MGWTGSITSSSAVGSKTTFKPDTSTIGGYTVGSFTAPRKGIYLFELTGSGGAKGATSKGDTDLTQKAWYECANGGEGGTTTGYLLLEKDQKVYVGCGGACSAAFVSSSTGSNLANVTQGNLYFVAGGGGQGGSCGESKNCTGYDCAATTGGNGGGSSGGKGASFQSTYGGEGGTQSAGGAGGDGDNVDGNKGSAGKGGTNVTHGSGSYVGISGRGGDGYYGGGSGQVEAYTDDDGYGRARAWGGGGGSGYVKTASFTYMDETYKSTTSRGGGAASNKSGSVVITLSVIGELPIKFNGTSITELVFNGTKVTSVVYNGTKLF